MWLKKDGEILKKENLGCSLCVFLKVIQSFVCYVIFTFNLKRVGGWGGDKNGVNLKNKESEGEGDSF